MPETSLASGGTFVVVPQFSNAQSDMYGRVCRGSILLCASLTSSREQIASSRAIELPHWRICQCIDESISILYPIRGSTQGFSVTTQGMYTFEGRSFTHHT